MRDKVKVTLNRREFYTACEHYLLVTNDTDGN